MRGSHKDLTSSIIWISKQTLWSGQKSCFRGQLSVDTELLTVFALYSNPGIQFIIKVGDGYEISIDIDGYVKEKNRIMFSISLIVVAWGWVLLEWGMQNPILIIKWRDTSLNFFQKVLQMSERI